MRRLAAILLVACGSHAPIDTAPPPPAPAAPDAAPAPPLACSVPLPKATEDAHGWRLGFESHRRETGRATCDVADDNLARAETAILALSVPTTGPARTGWDHKAMPARLDLVERRFTLSPDERARLYRDGFVVPARLDQPSYAWAYHEIYQSQLPVFVTADSILHAVYAAHDRLVADLERGQLAPLAIAMVQSLHCALPSLAPRLPRETARDLDIYLTVARRLLEGKNDAGSALGDAAAEKIAAELADKARTAGPIELVELFGRRRAIDFSQFAPRSHYTTDLAMYFRGAMWLSRTEWNLVSRSSRSSAPPDEPVDPNETPREDIDALALAQLVAAAGQTDRLAEFERAYTMLAGRREDVSVSQLLDLAKTARITDLRAPDAAEKLRAAIGDRFRRTGQIHPMPAGTTELPAIATLLGPRIVPDTLALRPIVHSVVPDRHRVHGGDIAYILGLDRGLAHLAADLAAFPTLRGQLDTARKALAAAPRTDDLYTAWLDAIRGLATPYAGAIPSFMDTTAFADLRVDSAIAAYAQIRHDHVLVAGQAYGHGGCVIPDGYVEPVPAVYDAIAAYADRGAAAFGATARAPYFARLGKIARVLSALSRLELANQPLPPDALAWLSMVTEILPYGSDGRPTYTGWYFDLFDARSDAIGRPDLVADIFTSPVAGVGYLGVQAPRIGVFVVDTGGGPRAMVGPVAHAYEYQGPPSPRLDDAGARKLAKTATASPWTAYEVPAPPEPSFRATYEYTWEGPKSFVVTLETKAALGTVTVELLDHHRMPVAKASRYVGVGATKLVFPRKDDEQRFELLHFQVGPWNGWGEISCPDGCSPIEFGAMTTAPPAEADDE